MPPANVIAVAVSAAARYRTRDLIHLLHCICELFFVAHTRGGAHSEIARSPARRGELSRVKTGENPSEPPSPPWRSRASSIARGHPSLSTQFVGEVKASEFSQICGARISRPRRSVDCGRVVRSGSH